MASRGSLVYSKGAVIKSEVGRLRPGKQTEGGDPKPLIALREKYAKEHKGVLGTEGIGEKSFRRKLGEWDIFWTESLTRSKRDRACQT